MEFADETHGGVYAKISHWRGATGTSDIGYAFLYVGENGCFSCSHGREGILRIIDRQKGLSTPVAQMDCASLTFMKATVARDSDGNAIFTPGNMDSINLYDRREGKSSQFLDRQPSKGMVMAMDGSINADCFRFVVMLPA